MSPSRDRKHVANAEEGNGYPTSGTKQSPSDLDANKSPDTTKERAQTFADDQDLEFDEAASDEEDAEIPEGSMFDYQIPGMLTKDEVKQLDLDHWRLLVRNALIDLEVKHLLEVLLAWGYR